MMNQATANILIICPLIVFAGLTHATLVRVGGAQFVTVMDVLLNKRKDEY